MGLHGHINTRLRKGLVMNSRPNTTSTGGDRDRVARRALTIGNRRMIRGLEKIAATIAKASSDDLRERKARHNDLPVDLSGDWHQKKRTYSKSIDVAVAFVADNVVLATDDDKDVAGFTTDEAWIRLQRWRMKESIDAEIQKGDFLFWLHHVLEMHFGVRAIGWRFRNVDFIDVQQRRKRWRRWKEFGLTLLLLLITNSITLAAALLSRGGGD